jgi:uncharacterized membrane protein
MKNITVIMLVRGAIIAALYVVLTMVLAPISYGPIQVRISEALTVLPVIFPEAIPALFIGAMIANVGSPLGLVDIIGGSSVTLLAAVATWYLRHNIRLALLPPVLFNAFLISIYVRHLLGWPYLLTVLSIGAGQVIAVYVLGWPLLKFLQKK